jgi:adenylate cyclase
MNRQLQKPLIEQYAGTWVKEIGDRVLPSFNTVTEAILCPINIQESCMHVPDLKLRIGIHQGEVVFENNDVFGDGVNIASRLQALAPIARIWISESVHKNVANKKEIKTKFVREEVLKNVKEAFRIYEVVFENKNTQINISSDTYSAIKTISEKSIAVLPCNVYVLSITQRSDIRHS